MKLFHKCTLGGLIVILKEAYKNEDFRLCCSSEESSSLFCRNYCVELDVPAEAVICSHHWDIDSHTETPWDEIRIYFKKEYIKNIIGSRKISITSQDIEHCVDNGVISANNDYDAKIVIKKILSKETITPIRKSGYTKKFLNI